MAGVVVLLRAVNVGGTGKLSMAELKAMCIAQGYSKVQTYIASGNVVFETRASPKRIKDALEARLKTYAGKSVGVIVRTADEMISVLKHNPFPKAAPNRTTVIFLDRPPKSDDLENLRHVKNEELRLGVREIYVHYGDGMRDSKLVIPAANFGTARNMNTVAKLAALAANL